MANQAHAAWSYQTWWREVRMGMEMYLFVGLMALLAQIILFGFLLWLVHTPQELANLWVYVKSGTIDMAYPKYVGDFVVNDRKYTAPAGAMFKSVRALVWPKIWKFESAVLMSFLAWLLAPSLIALFQRRASRLTRPTYIRGARFTTVSEVKRAIKKAGGGTIGIGKDVCLATAWEPEHIFGIGRSGSGKTTLVLQQIDALR